MHRMTLLEQLQQLAPLAGAATAGPWHIVDDNDGVVACYLLTPQAGSYVNPDGNYNDFANVGNQPDAAYIAAARNVLTPENLALLIAQQAVPVVGRAFGVQMLLAAEGPGATLWGEHLYVLLPDGTITQAMWCDFFINELEGEAWGCYTDVDEVNPLPVQPTHYFTPPTAPADAA